LNAAAPTIAPHFNQMQFSSEEIPSEAGWCETGSRRKTDACT